MDVFKFIGKRRSKCTCLNLNIKNKNAFRHQEKHVSDGMQDNFSDGETQGLRVTICIYTYLCVYMYIVIIHESQVCFSLTAYNAAGASVFQRSAKFLSAVHGHCANP